MSKINFSALLLVSVLWVIIVSCNDRQSVETNAETTLDPNAKSVIEHGEYLVTIMGCNDCHSPKRMGPNGPEVIPELRLSGFPSDRPIIKVKDSLINKGFAMFYPDLTAAVGPWGMSFAGNLTPDPTGIGNWSEEHFKTALTKGKFKGLDNARGLLPPMPVENYKNMKDEDVLAIFQYPKSIEPVRNIVPAPIAPDNM